MKLLRFTGMLALALLAWIGILIGLAFTAGPGKPLAIVTLPGRGLEVVAAAGGSYESLAARSSSPAPPRPVSFAASMARAR